MGDRQRYIPQIFFLKKDETHVSLKVNINADARLNFFFNFGV